MYLNIFKSHSPTDIKKSYVCHCIHLIVRKCQIVLRLIWTSIVWGSFILVILNLSKWNFGQFSENDDKLSSYRSYILNNDWKSDMNIIHFDRPSKAVQKQLNMFVFCLYIYIYYINQNKNGGSSATSNVPLGRMRLPLVTVRISNLGDSDFLWQLIR